MRHGGRLAAAVATITLIAGACGGDDNPSLGSGATSSTSPSAASREGDSGASCKELAGFAAGNQVLDKGAEPASGPEASVEAGDFFFRPTCTTGASSGTVNLTVHNTGQALHNVSIADQGIDQDVEAGKTISVQVQVASSPVQFVCKYHRTSGMVGALVPTAS